MPIIPGIMPVTNVRQIQRFAQLSGTPLPADMIERFERVADDADAVVELGGVGCRVVFGSSTEVLPDCILHAQPVVLHVAGVSRPRLDGGREASTSSVGRRCTEGLIPGPPSPCRRGSR